MPEFKNPEAALRAQERLEELTGLDLDSFIKNAFKGNAAPDLALTNLERWLRATSSPDMHMQQIAGLPPMGRLLVNLFGASQPIADTIIQNPELGTMVLDPSQLGARFDPNQVRQEGLRLLAAATSHIHALDRLRYLRQQWNLTIVMNDLAGTWEQQVVWKNLSDLADTIIELAEGVAWGEYARQKELGTHPDWMIVSFGKLGGSELNYSSDVDLVYVVEDNLSEKSDRDCTRFFEAFGRALSDRMGRGSLYRVDLRLRPYGGAGPITRSMRAYEAYYQLYAEPWEVQALLRSRPILGSPALRERWEAVRVNLCFRPKLSEISLEHMLEMKARIEQGASEDDLKRGDGGIRDVEFLTQILQMLHGHNRPELQSRTTCQAILALQSAGYLEPSVAEALIDGYTFLRKLEHRTQLVDDQQTHTIPQDPEAREGLAKLMGGQNWQEVGGKLERHRRTIQTLFRSTLSLETPTAGARHTIMANLGPLAPAALQWFDSFPESGAFYEGLVENEGSLKRVLKILNDSPRLVNYFKGSLALTEVLLSGEIEEIEDPLERLRSASSETSAQHLAEIYSHAYTLLLAQWTLSPNFNLGNRLSDLIDALIRHVTKQLQTEFDVVGLGSYGTREVSPGSDGDLLLLIADPKRQPHAEKQAQQFLAFLSQLKRFGAPIEFDLRLRPEGGKGLLVRTYDGLRAYDLDGMQMWERFALGQSRLIVGNPEALAIVLHSAYALPLTPERLLELAKMKRRVETERVKPQHLHREVKLGSGGLSDIEWLIHLNEMRYPTASRADTLGGCAERVRRLSQAHLVNALEADTLVDANRFLRDLRARIFLLGIDDDLLPENPDKLDRLAHACGYPDGNSLLSRHQSVVEPVRRLYVDGLERLKL